MTTLPDLIPICPTCRRVMRWVSGGRLDKPRAVCAGHGDHEPTAYYYSNDGRIVMRARLKVAA